MSFGSARIHRWGILPFLLLTCVLLLPARTGPTQKAGEPVHMLFLSFGSRDWPTFESMLDEFRVDLERRLGAPVSINVETFDAYGTTTEPAFEKTIEQLLARKYGNQSFEVVVAVGGRPMDFLLSRRATLFPGAKLLYTTVFHQPIPNATGVIQDANLLPTAEMALQQNPGTRRLLLITGSSPADQTGIAKLREGLQQQLSQAGRAIEVDTLAPMTYFDARQRLAALPRDTVGIFVFYFGDSTGQVVNPTKVLSDFSRVCPRPIYSVWEADVGRGSVGGRVISTSQVARALAGQAVRVLRGEEPGTIPPVRGAFHRDLFDWEQMKRWRIRLDQLPPGSTVINREYTAWELYRWQIIGGVALILVEAALIVLLLHLRRVRRRNVLALARSHRLESVMAELSAAFINLPAEVVNAQVDSALQHLLEVMELDRISVFEFSPDGQRLHLLFANRAAGIPPPPADVHSSEMTWLLERLHCGERVVASRLEDLPPEGRQTREFATRLGIRSVAIFPLHCEGVTFGKLTCATVRRPVTWAPDALEYLQAVADVFGNALKRKRAEAALVDSEHLKASILSSLNSQIAVVDPSGHIIASNDQWRALAQEPDARPDWIREGSHFGPCCGCEPSCQSDAVLDGARQVWEGRRNSFEMEYECISQSGEKRWFLMTVTPLRNAGGGAVISHHDLTESKRNEQAIRDLSGKLITAQEEERSRIARELHDDINQQLALLAIELQLLDKSIPTDANLAHARLEQLWKKTNELSADIQGLSHQLHSAKLEHLGLISALRELCHDFAKQQQIGIEFRSGDVPSNLDIEVSLTLFRIAQESLRNVGKHSRGTSVQVELLGSADHLTLRVSDDGVGFAPGLHPASSGLGMVSMQERLRLVRGELVVRAGEPHGTVVEARVPVLRQEGVGPNLAPMQVGLPSVGGKGRDEQSPRKGGMDRIHQIRPHL